MIPKIKVELILSSTQISPEEITRLIGISPTRFFRLGESIQQTALKNRANGWCFSISDYQSTYELGEVISKLLQRLQPFFKTIPQICEENNLYSEISCGVYVSDETPSINFSSDIIAKLNELKTTVDIDLIMAKRKT